MTEAEYLEIRRKFTLDRLTALESYRIARDNLMRELQEKLEPLKSAIMEPMPDDCLVIVEKEYKPGFSAYYPGSRKDYKAWLRIAHWPSSDEQEWQWLLDFDNIGNNSRTLNVLGKKGTYSVLKSQYPEMRKQAIDMLLAAGWKVLES